MKISAFASIPLAAAPTPLLAVQEAAEAAEGGGGSLFAVDLGLSVWTIVVFLIVLWVLAKYAWGPILGALDSREVGIRESIAEAQRLRAEAEAALEEHKKQLADARRQAQDIVAQGREAGEKVRSDIEAKAREESDRMIQRARGEIERERDRALETLRRESVDLAIAAASNLLERKLDSESDRALVEDYLDELGRPAAEA